MFSVRRIMWLQLGQRLSVNKIKQSKDWFIFEKLRFFIYYYLFSYKQFNFINWSKCIYFVVIWFVNQNQFDLCKFNKVIKLNNK